MRRLLLAAVILIAIPVQAAEPTAEDVRRMKVKLMEETKINAVFELRVAAKDYKPSDDSTTLDIVFLKRREDGPSRVSDDGRVIFLYKASDKTEQALFDQAFEIRALKALKEPNYRLERP